MKLEHRIATSEYAGHPALTDRLEPIIGELEMALTLRAGLMDSESRRDEVLRTLRASITSAVTQLKAIAEPESL